MQSFQFILPFCKTGSKFYAQFKNKNPNQFHFGFKESLNYSFDLKN